MKRIKFALQMKDGVQARTLEELRGAFDLELLLGYLEDGRLERWLDDRQYRKEAGKIAGLDKEDADLPEKLCGIFGVPYTEDMLAAHRYPRIMEILESAEDMDGAISRIIGCPEAIGELRMLIKDDIDAAADEVRSKISGMDDGCGGLLDDKALDGLSAQREDATIERLECVKAQCVDEVIHKSADAIFDGLSKLSNSGILTKPSKDSVIKVVEKFTIYREIIDAFDKAIQICTDRSRASRPPRPTHDDAMRLFKACNSLPGKGATIYYLSSTNRLTWEVYDEYAKKVGMV